MEPLQIQIEQFNEVFNAWHDQMMFPVNPDLAKKIFEIRSGMMKRTLIPQVDMLTYKKAILYDLKQEYANISNFEFTDEEIDSNRISTGENKDRKITKVLTEKIRENHMYYSEQRLDFFNKLRYPDTEYYIDSDPIAFADAYKKIRTCLSPNGENQSNFVKFLLSAYAYIVVDIRMNNRMLVLLNPEQKVAFLHNVYGGYDYMMSLSVVKFLVDEGYSFAKNLDDAFDLDYFMRYIDADEFRFLSHVEYFNGKIYDKYQPIDLWLQPYWYHSHIDALTDDHMPDHKYTTMSNVHDSYESILPEGKEYCGDCGEIVDANDYDFDSEICYYCAGNRNYCEACGEYTDADHFHFEEQLCDWCFNDQYRYCEECGENVRIENFDVEHHMCDVCVAQLAEEEESDSPQFIVENAVQLAEEEENAES